MAGDANFHSNKYQRSLRSPGGAARTNAKLKNPLFSGKAGQVLGGGLKSAAGSLLSGGLGLPSFGFSKSKSESASAAIDQKVGDYRGRFDGRVTIGGSGQFANAKSDGSMANSTLGDDLDFWLKVGAGVTGGLLFLGALFKTNK